MVGMRSPGGETVFGWEEGSPGMSREPGGGTDRRREEAGWAVLAIEGILIFSLLEVLSEVIC